MTHHGISVIFTYVSSLCAIAKINAILPKIGSVVLEEVKVHYEEYLTQKQSSIFFFFFFPYQRSIQCFHDDTFSIISDNNVFHPNSVVSTFVRTCQCRVCLKKKRKQEKKGELTNVTQVMSAKLFHIQQYTSRLFSSKRSFPRRKIVWCGCCKYGFLSLTCCFIMA